MENSLSLELFQDRKIIFSQIEDLSDDFKQKLELFLKSYTGKFWNISISDKRQKNEESLEQPSQLSEVKQLPLVKKALELFPEAKLQFKKKD